MIEKRRYAHAGHQKQQSISGQNKEERTKCECIIGCDESGHIISSNYLQSRQFLRTFQCTAMTLDLANWMKELPSHLHDVPIRQLSMPGSHDSGAFYLDSASSIAPGEGKVIIDLVRRFPCITKRIVRNWSITQSLSIYEQLMRGIRYFDFRVAFLESTKQFYVVHGLYGSLYSELFEQVNKFLEEHPKEFLILDFNHLYDFKAEQHKDFMGMIAECFLGKLYSSKAKGRNEKDGKEKDASDEDANERDANDEGANDEGANEKDVNEEGANEKDANDDDANEKDVNGKDANEKDANDEDVSDDDANEKGVNEKDTKKKDANDEDADEKDVNEKDANEKDANDEDANEKDVNEEGAKKKDANDEDADEKDVNEKDANEKDANDEDANEKDVNEEGAKKKDANDEDADEKDVNEEGAKKKDANDEDADEKDANEKDANEKDAHDEDANEKDVNEKDAKKKDANDEDANEKDVNEKDANEKDAHDENANDKDENEKDANKKDANVADAEKKDASEEGANEKGASDEAANDKDANEEDTNDNDANEKDANDEVANDENANEKGVHFSLNDVWGSSANIIALYNDDASTKENPLFWPRDNVISSPWFNTDKAATLINDLETELDDVEGGCFHVSQATLTPKTATIIKHLAGSLKNTLAKNCNQRVSNWLKGLDKEKKKKLNIVICDFIEMNEFALNVVAANYGDESHMASDY